MKIAIGADHAGFALKQQIGDALREAGHQVIDVGTHNTEATDYPDYAAAMAQDVAQGQAERGILVCATGVGMSIAADKVAGVRAALAWNPEEVELMRQHGNANVMALGAKFTDAATANQLIRIFIEMPFEGGGRHERRIAKIARLEQPT